MRTLTIDAYLSEIATKRSCDYSYGIRQGKGFGCYNLVIYRHTDDDKTEAF
jgi:hypothetical protein